MSSWGDERLKWAEQYIALEWPVFAVWGLDGAGVCACRKCKLCERPGKHPVPHNGVYGATLDYDRIAEVVSESPSYGLAVRAGRRSGISVLDVDPRNGGAESLAGLERRHGPLPETVRARTGGGGWHYYFAQPDVRFKNRDGEIGAGLDVRTDGGYVIVPPSIVHPSGASYVWEIDPRLVPPAPMPDWLLGRILDSQRRSKRDPGTVPRRSGSFRWTDYLDGAPEGRRHTTLFLIVCALRGPDVPRRFITDLALYFAARCRPAFPEDEALDLVDDVLGRYRPNARRNRSISPERLDVLNVLTLAIRPLMPAEVARRLGIGREAIKTRLADLQRDGLVIRVPGQGYTLPVSDTAVSLTGTSLEIPVSNKAAGRLAVAPCRLPENGAFSMGITSVRAYSELPEA